MSASSSTIFLTVVSQRLKDETKRRLLEQFHKRVQFKSWAAKQFLSNLKRLERKHGALTYPKAMNRAELNLDAFLYEIVGAFDTLLQEINVAFQCDLDIEKVKMETVISKMPTESKVLEKLRKLNGDSSGWFWKLREYRNHSAHRSVISFYSTTTVKPKPRKPNDDPQTRYLEVDRITATYLVDNPRDINSGRSKQEVIPYCNKSIINMRNLLEEIYKKCINDLSSKEQT